MKKLLVSLTVLSIVGFVGISKVSADQTANIAITVQIQSLGVSVNPTSWTIGAVGAGTTQDSGSFTVTNTGNVAEDFQLNTADSADWDNANAVTTGNAVAVDKFVLKALFDTAGVHTYAADDDVRNTPDTASGTRFADGDDSGNNVPASGAKSLYLQLGVPLAGSNTTPQTINVTITAQAH